MGLNSTSFPSIAVFYDFKIQSSAVITWFNITWYCTSLQQRRQNINHRLNPQKHPIPNGRGMGRFFYQYFGEIWPCYNSTRLYDLCSALYNAVLWTIPSTHWAWWRIYAPVNWVIIGSNNGLSPVQCQSIIWTHTDLMPIAAWKQASVIWEPEKKKFFMKEMRSKISGLPNFVHLSLVHSVLVHPNGLCEHLLEQEFVNIKHI